MNSAKDEVRRMLDGLPENSSLEDIQYHLYVRQKVENGLRDFEQGNVLTEDQAQQRIEKWLEE